MTLRSPVNRRTILSGLIALLFALSSAHGQTAPSPAPEQAAPALPASPLRLSRDLKPALPAKNDRDQPVSGSANKITGQTDEKTVLEGDAKLTRGSVSVTADLITYLHADDQVLLECSAPDRRARVVRQTPTGADTLTTPKALLNLGDNTGYAESPEVFYSRLNGRGKADLLENLPGNQSRLSNAQYTTCPPGNDSWVLKARKLLLDQSEDVGTGEGAVLYFKGAPILGAPYFQFPLGSQRRTGFLVPSLGLSSRTGVDVTLPYYINLAPNYDLTLEPRLMSKRGLQIGAEFRYLQENYRGDARLEWMPRDFVSKNQRAYAAAKHLWANDAWSGGWNVQAASDDRYFVDLSRSISNVSGTYLPRDAYLNYTRPSWNVSTRLSTFQTLQDPASPVLVPFDRLPQISWNYSRPANTGFDFNVNADMTRFALPAVPTGQARPEGWRAYIQPSLSYPLLTPALFVTPKLSLHSTRYWGLKQDADAIATPYTGPASATRTLPIFSLDAGLNLERDEGLLFSKWKQTLEPRVFYVRVPFRDQAKLPIFDTALTDFGFGQLFSENVFAGQDRIADADQLTLAASTRYLDKATSEERLRLAIGKRFYFRPQQVESAQAPQTKSSDLLLGARGQITPEWSLDSTVQLDTRNNQAVRSVFTARYNPAPRQLINVSHRYTRATAENGTTRLLDVSGQWQINANWYGVGRINYSLPERRISEAVAGVEYDQGCWRIRTFVSRYAVATQKATTSLFFQLELVGLGSIGNDPLALLKRSVPGYRKLESPELWTNPNPQ